MFKFRQALARIRTYQGTYLHVLAEALGETQCICMCSQQKHSKNQQIRGNSGADASDYQTAQVHVSARTIVNSSCSRATQYFHAPICLLDELRTFVDLNKGFELKNLFELNKVFENKFEIQILRSNTFVARSATSEANPWSNVYKCVDFV